MKASDQTVVLTTENFTATASLMSLVEKVCRSRARGARGSTDAIRIHVVQEFMPSRRSYFVARAMVEQGPVSRLAFADAPEPYDAVRAVMAKMHRTTAAEERRWKLGGRRRALRPSGQPLPLVCLG